MYWVVPSLYQPSEANATWLRSFGIHVDFGFPIVDNSDGCTACPMDVPAKGSLHGCVNPPRSSLPVIM